MSEILSPSGVVDYDVEKIRADFPILHQKVRGNPLVYLDNAATTQKPKVVINALSGYYSESNANVHRALHHLAEKATIGYEGSRKAVADFIDAGSPDEIVITSGATASINLVAQSWGRKFLSAGDEILLTEMEHHSNIVPWHLLARQKGIVLKFIPFNFDGCIDIKQIEQQITPRTKLISLTHMSNVLGTINPVREIASIAHQSGIKVLVDAAQSVPNMPVSVRDIDCDFLAFSSHKMAGPTGIGVLYGKKELLEEMDPFMGGGEMIATVSTEEATWAEVPHKFEAGTPNIAAAFGLTAAINYLTEIGMENIKKYKDRLTHYAIDAMRRVEGLQIFGNSTERGSAISFRLDDVHAFDLAPFLDQHGIAIRAGHHCAQPLMKKLNISATARASLYFYNTFQEIDIFVETLKKAKSFF